jgi:HisJ family histidinol phosphate phosphatase
MISQEHTKMPFSHHSHSGQFCPGHAKDSLEEVIQTAISKKMKVFCLTEHMPRHKEDFYPEEVHHSGRKSITPGPKSKS